MRKIQPEEMLRIKAACTFPKCACATGCPYMASLCYARPKKDGRVLPSGAEIRAAARKPCPYCGFPMLLHDHPAWRPSRDHIVPTSRGGGNVRENIVVVCYGCNDDKDRRTLEEWLQELTESGDRRARYVAGFIQSRQQQSKVTLSNGEVARDDDGGRQGQEGDV
jgi:hypothetical protein